MLCYRNSCAPWDHSVTCHMADDIPPLPQPIKAGTRFINHKRMKGWVGPVGWSVADGLPTTVVTHQLQVECRTGSLPAKDQHSTTVLRNQQNSSIKSKLQVVLLANKLPIKTQRAQLKNMTWQRPWQRCLDHSRLDIHQYWRWRCQELAAGRSYHWYICHCRLTNITALYDHTTQQCNQLLDCAATW